MAAHITTLPIAMLIQQNFLRIVRKRTQLTQVDIASILKISDFANVSRWEQGLKTPGVEILLAYHLLFDIPIESLFDRQKHDLKEAIVPRIQERVAYLKGLESDPKTRSRIDHLGSILNRLAL
jgi:transcriptional regulator with XRE-family HTH domain